MTKKEILKLLEPFDDDIEINIQYAGELQLSLMAVTNHSVHHLGDTIKKDFSPRNNCGFNVVAKRNEIEHEKQCIDIHVARTICEFPQFRAKPICKNCPLKDKR